MFTGLVQATGDIAQVQEQSGDKRFLIASQDLGFSQVKLGDSICVNGVCLTVVALEGDAFWTDVSSETLTCTTFDTLQIGDAVNLEKSLTPATPMGGHFVTGHVDGLAVVTSLEKDARSVRFRLKVPKDLAKYIAAKGSVCLDGTSLTVNDVEDNEFGINIIPHTYDNTLFKQYNVGSVLNLEIDLIARYVERLAAFTNK